ncbi:MAG: hypothetical protein MUD11_07520 [Rhodobacteraceae bacterium]|nr:hypothetical protein [Paracoccaceae bacterium]
MTVLICAALLVLIAQPFVPYGNGIRAGLGEVMNGVAGLVLLLGALVWALVARKGR